MKLLKTSLSILEIYKFALVTIVGFMCSIVIGPIIGAPVFFFNMLGALLCLCLLLNEMWLSYENQEKVVLYLWYTTLVVCLPFLSTFILIRSNPSLYWMVHFILANLLLLLLVRNNRTFYALLAIGLCLGFLLGWAVNLYVKPVTASLSTNFSIYSCIFVLLRMALVVHDRMYVESYMYRLVSNEVQDRTKDLSEALSVKTEFLNNMSHEIKTPIHTMTNMVSELHDQWHDMHDKERLECLRMIKNDHLRLESLCSNLLDLSQFTKGCNLELKKCNLRSLIDGLLEEFRNFAHLISIEIAPEAGHFIYCDKGRTSQVLRNLLDNAIKYGNGSPMEIAINVKEEDIVFAVSDEGVGIPQQELESIFKPFEQSSRTKTRAGGTGLGLSICKKIVECHQGKIWAVNNPKKGVTFFFTIPLGK